MGALELENFRFISLFFPFFPFSMSGDGSNFCGSLRIAFFQFFYFQKCEDSLSAIFAQMN